jgi:4-hydroxybenzoate polyprenyltransferase
LIRPLNLGIIFVSFLLAFHLAGEVFFPQGLLPAAAWVFLAAAGYAFNDLRDRPADAVNRPERPLPGGLSVEKARRVVSLFALAAFFLAFFFPFPLFVFILLVGGLLFLYALLPRKGLFLGNVAVALATASPFPAVMLFKGYTPPLGLGFLFSFFIVWMREIAKDFDDLEGDRRAGRKTLPIIAGKTRGLRFLWVLTFILAGFTMWGSLMVQETGVYALFIISGVNLCNAVALAAMTKGAYRNASLLLKVSILLGMGGLWLSV